MTSEDEQNDEGVLAGTATTGALAGVAAYTVGLGVVVGLARMGILTNRGVWNRLGGEFGGQVLAHQSAHVPFWNASIHVEMLPVTVVLGVVVGLAGGLVASSTNHPSRERAVEAGQSVAVGYAPAAVGASVYLAVTDSQVETLTLVAPTVLAGLVFPAVVGGLGAALAYEFAEG